MAVTLELDVEARIAEAVERRRELLEQLVRERVDAVLVELVDREVGAALERLAARNGNGATPARAEQGDGVTQSPPPELCTACGERPRLAGRTVCQSCRHARARERRAKPAASSDDGPRTGSTPPIR